MNAAFLRLRKDNNRKLSDLEVLHLSVIMCDISKDKEEKAEAVSRAGSALNFDNPYLTWCATAYSDVACGELYKELMAAEQYSVECISNEVCVHVFALFDAFLIPS